MKSIIMGLLFMVSWGAFADCSCIPLKSAAEYGWFGDGVSVSRREENGSCFVVGTWAGGGTREAMIGRSDTCSGGGSGSNSGCTAGAAPPFGDGKGDGDMPSAVCIGGCTFNTGPICLGGDGTWSCDIGKGTGQSCSASQSSPGTSYNPTATTNGCTAKGLCGGDVNGVEVCNVCSPQTKVQTKSQVSQSKNTNNSDTGSSSQSNSTATKTTVCQNGECTTTIINNYNTTTTPGSSGSGSGSGSGTSTNPNDPPANGSQTQQKTQSQASFCSENPDSAICKGFNDECKDKPDLASCKNMGTPSDTDGGTLSTKSIGLSSITIVPLASNASCPAPIPLPYGAQFDFGMMCTFASSIRPIVLVLAWIAAGMIVFGFKSES